MSWRNSCSAFPRIGGYVEAEAFFNGASAVRSSTWTSDERPLGRRVDHNKRIVRRIMRRESHDAYVYELVLYNTPLVTYMPDGEVLIVRHDAKLSRSFLNAVLPAGLRTVSHRNTTMVCASTPDGPAWYLGGFAALRFTPHVHNQWQLNSAPQTRYRQQLCLKRAAQIRKAAKPFLDWVAAHRALLGADQLLWPVPSRAPAPKSFEQLQDVQAWPDLEPYVGNRTEWMQAVYDTLGARTKHVISNYEPPRRGRGSFCS